MTGRQIAILGFLAVVAVTYTLSVLAANHRRREIRQASEDLFHMGDVALFTFAVLYAADVILEGLNT